MSDLSLLNDIIFKIVFATDSNRPLLRALLNALLGLSGAARIADLEILNPFLDKEYLAEKGVILDVKARDAQGRLYNIEVQVSDEPAYVERALYYLARLFASQLEKGEPYTRIARTIGISLVDFILFPDLSDLHSTYRLHDAGHGVELTDVLELHFIELAKFRRDKPQELRTPFEKWLHVLRFGELYESHLSAIPEELRQEEGIEMALDAMRKASARDEVREMIELRKKAQRDEATRLERAEQKGLQQGLEQGLQQGLEQGLKDTARRMRDEGLASETILRITGLRIEDIEDVEDVD